MLSKASGVSAKVEMEMEVNIFEEIPDPPDSDLSSEEEVIDEDKIIANCKCCGIKCGKLLKCCLKYPALKKICCCLKLKPKGKKPKLNLNFLLCLTIVCSCSGM